MKNFYFTESKSQGAGNSSGQLFVRETNKKSRHFWLQLILCLLAFFVVGRVSAKQNRTFSVTMNNTTINPTKPYIELNMYIVLRVQVELPEMIIGRTVSGEPRFI
jgi:hypothetical protein